MTTRYEVLALRYGSITPRTRRDNFVQPDDHAASMPLDFFVFVIRGGGRVFVVDTGFVERDSKVRGRALKALPAEVLARAGVDASTVEDVIITHMHWDHAGGMDSFPQATFHIQEAEMAYCTGRCMCHKLLRTPFDAEHVVSAIRALYSDRVKFYDGEAELAPGISLHRVGGHTDGIQVVRVLTERGWVVLASDAAHYWENIRARNPFPLFVDLPDMLTGFDTLERLADGPDHIIPGHDPAILNRFPLLGGDPDIARVDLAPID